MPSNPLATLHRRAPVCWRPSKLVEFRLSRETPYEHQYSKALRIGGIACFPPSLLDGKNVKSKTCIEHVGIAASGCVLQQTECNRVPRPHSDHVEEIERWRRGRSTRRRSTG